jgi:hypothetical protein
MLWLLDHYGGLDAPRYDSSLDMTVIGTISAIAPGWQFRESRYRTFDAHFTEQQRQAIAAYVDGLPGLVDLVPEDATLVERSIRDYWGRFLPRGA